MDETPGKNIPGEPSTEDDVDAKIEGENAAPDTDAPEEEPAKLTAEEEIDAAVEKSGVKEKKKKSRKKKIKYGASAAGVAFLSYLIYLMFIPYTGSMAFGLCKVFLELNVRYPTTLKLSTVEELGSSVRIWYTQTDSFGEYRMEPIQCYFKADENYGFILERVAVRRRDVDQKKVDDFNRVLPVVFAHPPDLTLPTPLPDSLRDLQIETSRFRKPIL